MTVRWLFAALGASSLVVSSCEVGPEYVPPKSPIGADAPFVAAQAGLEAPVEPPETWWRLYRDTRLDRFVEAAFASNDDLLVGEANLAAARSLFDAARAGQYPTTVAKTGGIYGRDAATDQILEIGGHEPSTIWKFEDVLDVSYELDLFGHVSRSIEASKADADAAAATRDAVKISVAAETVRAYAQICTLGERLSVARHSVDVAGHEAKIVSDRQAAGAATPLDVVRTGVVLAQAQAEVPPLEGQRRAALFQLSTLLGLPPSKAPTEALDCAKPPQLAGDLPIGDGAALLRRRPDVRAAERRLAGATARIGVATADLYPRISLEGLFGGAATEVGDLASGRALTWGVGPSVSWAFPIQAGPRARVRQAEAASAAALASFDATVLQALRETETALAIYGAELQHRKALGEAQARARQAFSYAQGSFLAGALSNLDLLTAEQTSLASDLAVAASDAAVVQDQIAVFKALGGGWAAPASHSFIIGKILPGFRS